MSWLRRRAGLLRRAASAAGVLLLGAALTSCASVPSHEQRAEQAATAALARGWQQQWIDTPQFRLTAWTSPQKAPLLWVYIEGDGLAWLSADQPSIDPTPLQATALQMALAQPAGAAAYLARPCQFSSGSACDSTSVWTAARFSPDVIDAMGQALDQLKQRQHAQQLVLVGYSGGAAVAALLAERRTDVVGLVSAAGNLDPESWVRLHGLSPLQGSLDPMEQAWKLRELPQLHFAGGRDRTIEPALIQGFAASMSRARVVVVDGFDHGCCWGQDWPRLWPGSTWPSP